MPEGVPVQEREVERGEPHEIAIIRTREAPPRDFHICRGCSECSSWDRELTRQPHSEACRKRFEDLLSFQARFQNQKARMGEFEGREFEKIKKRGEGEILIKGKMRVEIKKGKRKGI